MFEHQRRVVNEKKDLDEKLQKLGSFITSAGFIALPLDERDRMNRQYTLMDEYSRILGERIENFPPPPKFVRLLKDITGDFPFHDTIARAGVHEAEWNPYGALAVRAENGKMLGIKPAEYVPADETEVSP